MNNIDLILKGDNALGSQYQPVDLGGTTDYGSQWLTQYLRMVHIRPNPFGALTDGLIWVNSIAITLTMVPSLPWLLLPIGAVVLLLAVGSALPGSARTLSLVRLMLLALTTLLVLS